MSYTFNAAALLVAVALCTSACFGGSDDGEPEVRESASDARNGRQAESEAGQGRDGSRQAESGGAQAAPGTSVRSLRELAQRAGTVIGELQQQADQPIAEPVDFRQLRDLLPDELAGLARTDLRGEKQQVLGTLGVSRASATYLDDDAADPANLSVEIQDLGGMSSLAALGVAWFFTSIDSETSTGFRRTREFDGHRGYQEFDSAGGYGQGRIEVFVADRFMVKIDGRRVEPDVLERALQDIDLRALARMRDAGREAT
jgi:hypothetical protein